MCPAIRVVPLKFLQEQEYPVFKSTIKILNLVTTTRLTCITNQLHSN